MKVCSQGNGCARFEGWNLLFRKIRSAELSVDSCLGQFVVGEANYAEYRSDTRHSFVP